MYTVKQVSEITGISGHTIRFYDKEGLFRYVSRNENNVRLFSEKDVDRMNMIHCLRDTGMSLADIKEYFSLCNQGKSTAEKRYDIILKQKEMAEQEVIKMQERVKILKKKAEYYKTMIEEYDEDIKSPLNCLVASQENK